MIRKPIQEPPQHRRGRLLRAARLAGGGLALLVVVAMGSLLLWIAASLPPLDGAERVRGLRAEVVVERDAGGRVTVRASHQWDLAFGTGYAHGQDRFFQMDLLRRIGGGTLAALLGPSGVTLDQGARRHDLGHRAQVAFERSTPEERATLDAYAAGVNAGLGSLGARPWEYILLRQTPRAWRPPDTFLVALAMFRDLQDETNGRERVLDLASRALRPEVFGLLTVSPGPWEAPIQGEVGGWPEAQIPAEGPGRGEIIGEPRRPLESGLETALGSTMTGSNAFAVDGRRTTDGRAILANDMHLRLGVPTIWYPIRCIRTGPAPLDAVGVSLPGAPAVVAGSNGHIAWGLTNSHGDWLDHVVLELDPRDPNRYRSPEGWRHLRTRRESIEVARGDPVPFEVDDSIWGPLVGQDPEGRPLALRWVAQEPEALNLRLVELVEQTSVEQALDLAPRIGAPAQSILVADSGGRIGWTLMGRIPKRAGLNGPRPASWADGRTGWLGWLDAGEVPRIQPGDRDRLWTANGRVLDLKDQGIIGDGGYDLGARARRIQDLLEAQERFDEADLLRIQLDDRAELMALWHRRLLGLIESERDLPGRERLIRLLEDWDGHAGTQSVAYRLVHAWRVEVSRSILGALGRSVPGLERPIDLARIGRTEVPVWAILGARPGWVPPGYADWAALERSCLLQVLVRWGEPDRWARRTWGERNRTRIEHPLSPVLPHWVGRHIDLPARAVPGDEDMPRVAAPTFGASERMVVAPGAEGEGILQLPGGPSAHPFSAFRLGDYDAWVTGQAVPLLPGPTLHRRRLIPATGEESGASWLDP